MSISENRQDRREVTVFGTSIFEKSVTWLLMGAILATLCTAAILRTAPSREQANVLVSAAHVLHTMRPTAHEASPLLAYLAAPIRMVSGLLHGYGILLYKSFVALVALCSCLVCWRVLASFSGFEDRSSRGAITLSILAVFLMLPLRMERYNGFGGSQNVLLMLTLPYLLARAAQRKPLQGPLAVLAGAMAAVGFMIHPGFVVAWLILEVFLALTQRTSQPWKSVEFRVAAVGIFVLAVITFVASPTTVPFIGVVSASRALLLVSLIEAPSSTLSVIMLLLVLLVFRPARLVAEPVRVLSVAAVGLLLAAGLSPTGGEVQYYAADGVAILIIILLGRSLLARIACESDEQETPAPSGSHAQILSVLMPSVALAGVVFLIWTIGKQRGFPFMDAVAIPDLTPLKCLGIYALIRMMRSGVGPSAQTLILRALILGLVGYTGAEIIRTAQHGLAPNSALVIFALSLALLFIAEARSSGALNWKWSGAASIFLLTGLVVTAGEAALFGLHAPGPEVHPQGAGRNLVAMRATTPRGVR